MESPRQPLECIGLAGFRPKTFRSDCRASLIKSQYRAWSVTGNPAASAEIEGHQTQAGRYLGCALLGLAASSARAAIQASYSGEPRRGGTPGGSPPSQCGMSASRSPMVWPAQADSERQARHNRADLSIGEEEFIEEVMSS